MEEDSITFGFCRNCVDHWVLVGEEEILEGLRMIFKSQQMLVEGSAALALASLNKKKELYQGKSVVLIVCGKWLENDIIKKVVYNL